jgi:MFS superfamily sulfate permease-like transporter
LNGIALVIIAGQLGALLGFQVPAGGFFHTLATALMRLREAHPPTLALGLTLLAVLLLLKRLAPRVPAPLVAAALGIGAVYVFQLDRQGVAVVGTIPAGWPPPRVPTVALDEIVPLLVGASGIVLVSFCSMMTTARGFAARNGYAIRPNQDFVALGAADLAAGLSQGFAVSGADSRTAVADASGGRTQVTALVAAATMALVLLFLTAPLAALPTAALAAILISSAVGLFDVGALRRYYHLSRPEFRDSVLAMLGIMTVGVLPGVLIAIGLALLKLLSLAARPPDAVLGLVTADGEVHATEDREGALTIPGLLLYRFDASLVFFNAEYFQDRVRTLIAAAERKPEWVLFDAESSNLLDTTAADALASLHAELAAQGIVLAVARATGLFRVMLERSGVAQQIGAQYLFPTVHAGARAFQQRQAARAGGD